MTDISFFVEIDDLARELNREPLSGERIGRIVRELERNGVLSKGHKRGHAVVIKSTKDNPTTIPIHPYLFSGEFGGAQAQYLKERMVTHQNGSPKRLEYEVMGIYQDYK